MRPRVPLPSVARRRTPHRRFALFAFIVVAALVAAAQAGIQVTIGPGGQIQITTSLSQTELSSLTATLTNFNEGKFPGFSSCPEE